MTSIKLRTSANDILTKLLSAEEKANSIRKKLKLAAR